MKSTLCIGVASERMVWGYTVYCGQIDYADEPPEEDPGGYACVCTNNLTPLKLKVAPAGLPGRVTLSANVDETRIKVWRNANRTGAVPLPKVWTAGAAIPDTLYVEGVTNSASARDIALKLTYDENPPNKSNPLFRCEDRVRLTVLKVELEINNTADETDDVVCRYSTNPAGRPTIPCRARIQGLGSGSKTIVLTSTKVRFPSATDTTKTLLLPASGAWVNFTTSGQTESAAKDDALIEAHLDTATGAVCGSEDLSVLWVAQSMGTTQDAASSADNNSTLKPVPTKLGKQKVAGPAQILPALSYVVEFAGQVKPTDFDQDIRFLRDSTQDFVGIEHPDGTFQSQVQHHARTPVGNDTGDPLAQDQDPQPNGKIYDWDMPGFGLTSACP